MEKIEESETEKKFRDAWKRPAGWKVEKFKMFEEMIQKQDHI